MTSPRRSPEALHYRALVLFLDIDGQRLPRLADLAVDCLQNHLGAGNGQLVAFAAHVLDQDREVQLATAGNLELVRVLGRLDAECDVVDQLLVEARAQVAAGDVLALAPAQRRVVDLKGHADRRLVYQQRRQRLDHFGIADRVRDLQPVDAGKGDDVAGARLVQLDPLEPVEGKDLQYPTAPLATVRVGDDHLGVAAKPAAPDAGDADDADVAGVVERADLHLQWSFQVNLGRRHEIDDGLEQRGHAAIAHPRVRRRPALGRRSVDDREV